MRVVTACYDKETGKQESYTIYDRENAVLQEWKERDKEKDIESYKRYFDMFDIDKYKFVNKTIVDIGCGAWGGITSFFPESRVIAVDPMLDKYKDIFSYSGEFADIEDGDIKLFDNSVDYVFCLNTLDHCDKVKGSKKLVDESYRILKDSGIMYVHVHFRKDDELSLLHLYSLNEKDISEYFNKFSILQWLVKNTDCISGKPYKTFWGAFRK